MRQSVITLGNSLVKPMHKATFSQLLADLIIEAHDRHASGGDKAMQKSMAEILELLAENRALKAKIEKLEGVQVGTGAHR